MGGRKVVGHVEVEVGEGDLMTKGTVGCIHA